MTQSIRALLHEIVDYAGLFPPASLDLATATRQYAAYRKSSDRWMLGSFILPIAQLHEFSTIVKPYVQRWKEPWLVNVLGSNDPQADRAAIEQFNRRLLGAVFVDALEVKAASSADIRAVNDVYEWSPTLTRYHEIPIDHDPDELISTIAEGKGRAKVRTGGVTPDAFPATADLLRFLDRCNAHNVAWKATAGLHHPIRAAQRLTYAEDAPRATMYGFLNVFLAAALLRNGADGAIVAQALEETAPAAFRFDDTGVQWHDQQLSTAQLEQIRATYAISFGSCSFREPVDDLKAINLL